MVLGLADAAGHALGLEQAAKTLPVTAISLTPEQARNRLLDELGWVGMAWFGLNLLLGGLWLFTDALPERRWIFIALPIGVTAIALAVALFKWSRRAGYTDPLTRIEVTAEEVIVRGRFGTDRRPYDQLVVTDILTRAPRNSVYFEGIEIETALGPIRLGDEWFTGGNGAAGAILKRMDELGVPLRLRGGFLS